MSILNSIYLDQLPDRDRWGRIENDDTIAVHVAVSGYHIVHLSLEEGDGRNIIEVNMTAADALELQMTLSKAISEALRGEETLRKKFSDD